MHIADVTLFHAPTSGGVRTYLEAKRQRLAQWTDVTHHLLIPGKFRRVRGNIIEVPAPPLPLSDGYRFPLRRQQFINELLALSPDIIEAGDPYIPAWAALAAGRKLDVPVVGFYHSDVLRLFSNRVGPLVNPATRLYVRMLYSQFHKVLAPSHVMARQLASCGVDNVTVQPLGVDLEIFHPGHAQPNLRQLLGLGDHIRLMVFAGRGSREKNLPVLIKAARRLGDNYHLLLVGSNMPLHVPGNVTVINRFCDSAMVARILASADVLVHAGDQETFGLVILEAMASGTPVAVVNAGAFPELVPESCGRLAQPNNPDDLARVVREMYAEGIDAMGQAARALVEKQYSWDTVVASLLAHYQKLLGLPATAGLGWSHG